MAQSSSFATVAEQIINYNTNVLELIGKLNDLSVSDRSTIPIQFTDSNGVLNTYEVPSIGYLKSEIDRLNNNLNTLYSIDTNGAVVQPANNVFKKIITVDLNREPNSVNGLDLLSTFTATKNWFFDGLMNPQLNVEIDLTDRVEDSVRKCLVRRFLVEFERTEDGSLTSLGLSAQNSWNNEFRNNNAITLDDFLFWHQTTPGVVNPNDPNFDEQMFDLNPNELLYDGVFTVLRTEEDTLNRKLWYHLNTLDYIVTDTEEQRQLAVDDEVIINKPDSSTRYKVIEISTAASNPRVRFERIEGLEPIPVATGALKIYSPVINNKILRVSIDYDSRNVLFVKPMDADTHILAREWGNGVGFWSNDLTLESNDSENGKTLEQFYTDTVYDYGRVLQDLVEKKIPDSLGDTPSSPDLLEDNFKVVQINKHLTDRSDSREIKRKFNLQKDIKSELTQLTDSIQVKQKELRTSKFANKSQEKKFNNDLNELVRKKESKSKLLSTTVSDIISLSNISLVGKATPKFRVRGFWNMPDPVIVNGSKPQEVVQFKVQYRYASKDGQENATENFQVKNAGGELSENAAFSNWTEILTDTRKRVKNEQGEWIWEIQDVADADTPNINQLDIPITQNERVEIRVKSLSEVGWPDSPIESEWSEILTIEFPDDLNNVLGEDDFILREATAEELKVRLDSELQAKGLDDHLSETFAVGDEVYLHTTDRIASGFKDDNGNIINLFDYIQTLTNKINSLEEQINRSRGILQISIFRQDEELVVKNGEEIVYNIECEDYLNEFTGSGAPSGRVYANEIIVIRDFFIRVSNVATESPLGLRSNRVYYANQTDVGLFSTSAPQVFWVNDRDELVYNDSTGNTRTQLNNQFIWSSNFTTVEGNTVTKLSENIGNNFTTTNSLTPVLSSTEFNVGYLDNTILSFVGSNSSIIEPDKWVDENPSVASNTKLLTTIHPVTTALEDLVETNSDKIKEVDPGEVGNIEIPLNIYFKMNSLDPNAGSGANYEYVDLNRSTTTVKHIKKVKFFLENEAENRAFTFTIKFNINRSKVGIQKITPNLRAIKAVRIR